MSANDRSGSNIHAQIARMARSLHNTTDNKQPLTPDDVMREVTATAVRAIPGVDHAGVSLLMGVASDSAVESSAATDEVAAAIDRLQDTLKTGPCHSTIRTEQTVLVDDYTEDQRWPEFTAAVTAGTEVRSSLSIQLFTDRSELGSLNLYSQKPSAFTDEVVDQALALAAHGAVALSSARRSEQFRSALASRDIIGQIKGVVMERYDLDAVQAFHLLTRLSQNENIKLVDLAQKLIDTDHPTK